jgi:hypothetical protein
VAQAPWLPICARALRAVDPWTLWWFCHFGPLVDRGLSIHGSGECMSGDFLAADQACVGLRIRD